MKRQPAFITEDADGHAIREMELERTPFGARTIRHAHRLRFGVRIGFGVSQLALSGPDVFGSTRLDAPKFPAGRLDEHVFARNKL